MLVHTAFLSQLSVFSWHSLISGVGEWKTLKHYAQTLENKLSSATTWKIHRNLEMPKIDSIRSCFPEGIMTLLRGSQLWRGIKTDVVRKQKLKHRMAIPYPVKKFENGLESLIILRVGTWPNTQPCHIYISCQISFMTSYFTTKIIYHGNKGYLWNHRNFCNKNIIKFFSGFEIQLLSAPLIYCISKYQVARRRFNKYF